MLASIFTRLTVTPGWALSKVLINLSVNRLSRMFGTATVNFTLASCSAVELSAGACVGGVLPAGAPDRSPNSTPPATSANTTTATIRVVNCLDDMEVSPHRHDK